MRFLEAISQRTVDIFKHQNEKIILQCLAAQRNEYDCAKEMNFYKLVANIALAGFMCVAFYFDTDELVSLSVLASVITLVYCKNNDRERAKTKKDAAAIQQYIDANLYSGLLGKDINIWGNLPSKTVISEAVARVGNTYDENLKNWYTKCESDIVEYQIFSCQRQNINWEKDLREEYIKYQWIVLFFFGVVALIIFFHGDYSFVKAISFSSSLLSVFDFVYTNNSCVNDDMKRLEEIKRKWLDWEKIILCGGKKQKLELLIEMQDCIRENRENAYLLPNWFYNLKKDRNHKREENISKAIKDIDDD